MGDDALKYFISDEDKSFPLSELKKLSIKLTSKHSYMIRFQSMQNLKQK